MDIFAVKVDGNDVTQESVKRFSYTQIPELTSLRNFNSKKVHEDDIFVRQDILRFSSVESKDYKYLKSP